MIEQMRVVAIIPARGGSKGIKQKNLAPLNGKPLIAWTIEAAMGSKIIDRLVLSTEDNEIAKCAKNHGCDVPFERPKSLATDNASSIDVMLHTLDQLNLQGENYDIVVMLEPTSPLRSSNDIDDAISQLVVSRVLSIVSIFRIEGTHPAFLYKKDKDNKLTPLNGVQPTNLRRQEITSLYALEGSIYASYVKTLRDKKSFYHDKTIGYVVPPWKSVEIDNPTDLIVAEALMKAKF